MAPSARHPHSGDRDAALQPKPKRPGQHSIEDNENGCRRQVEPREWNIAHEAMLLRGRR